jgi:asparagine synthase (glutamine-hydrolysing)
MCGIAGFWSAAHLTEDTARGWINGMTDRLVHRGPDGSGAFFDPETGIGFGHRRLSIVDLSAQGRQPMWSRSGRYCITYNGEVYNAPELRSELDARGAATAWRGHSDTEIMLEAIEALGLESALARFRGMFAFALWDAQTKRLFLVRDRLGIKPVLYVQGSFGVAFASELQALYALPTFEPRLDRQAVAAFLRYGAVPCDQCIVKDVRKVQPGTLVCFNDPKADGRNHTYWSAKQVVSEGLSKPFQGSVQEAIETLDDRIRKSVSLRMRSDVPLGAFLSGGIDSSIVAAMMQQEASRPIKTFCIGNRLAGYDESSYAEVVAGHLGTEHHTLIADPSDMLSIVPEIARRWDEPFADSSQIPTFMVSRLTREHVTVALSGDGGDEIFAGYNRHSWAPRLWKTAHHLPRSAKKALGALKLVRVDDWDRAFRAVGLGNAIRLPGDKLYKVAAIADANTSHEFYERLRSHWVDPAQALAGHSSPEIRRRQPNLDASFAEQTMYYDMVEYLPDDILTKVDRASMAVSLEARVPLLDHEVVELAWRFPLRWKIRGHTSKWILRQVLARHVPARLFDRPKTGFGVPVGQWLRGPLREWGAELLDPCVLSGDGILDVEVAAGTWEEHQAGRGNHEHRLWTLLMFQSWWTANRRHIRA